MRCSVELFALQMVSFKQKSLPVSDWYVEFTTADNRQSIKPLYSIRAVLPKPVQIDVNSGNSHQLRKHSTTTEIEFITKVETS